MERGLEWQCAGPQGTGIGWVVEPRLGWIGSWARDPSPGPPLQGPVFFKLGDTLVPESLSLFPFSTRQWSLLEIQP